MQTNSQKATVFNSTMCQAMRSRVFPLPCPPVFEGTAVLINVLATILKAQRYSRLEFQLLWPKFVGLWLRDRAKKNATDEVYETKADAGRHVHMYRVSCG